MWILVACAPRAQPPPQPIPALPTPATAAAEPSPLEATSLPPNVPAGLGCGALGDLPVGEEVGLLSGWYHLWLPVGARPLPPVGWGTTRATIVEVPAGADRLIVVAQNLSFVAPDPATIGRFIYPLDPVEVRATDIVANGSELVFRAPGRARPAPDVERVLELTDARPGEPVVTVAISASRERVAEDPAGCRAVAEAWAGTLRRGTPHLVPLDPPDCVESSSGRTSIRALRAPDEGPWYVGPHEGVSWRELTRLASSGDPRARASVWLGPPPPFPRHSGERQEGRLAGVDAEWRIERYDDGDESHEGIARVGPDTLYAQLSGPAPVVLAWREALADGSVEVAAEPCP